MKTKRLWLVLDQTYIVIMPYDRHLITEAVTLWSLIKVFGVGSHLHDASFLTLRCGGNPKAGMPRVDSGSLWGIRPPHDPRTHCYGRYRRR